MKAPEKIRIGGREYTREDLLKPDESGLGRLAKVEIPKELWLPIHKKLSQKPDELKALKKILKSGESEALIEFARKHDLDYGALRQIMTLINPSLHSSELLQGVLSKAVRALKDAGVVDPIKITSKELWDAWMKSLDNEAKG